MSGDGGGSGSESRWRHRRLAARMHSALMPVAMSGRARAAWWLVWVLFLACTAGGALLVLWGVRSLLPGAPELVRTYVPLTCALLVLVAVFTAFFGERHAPARTGGQERTSAAVYVVGALLAAVLQVLLRDPWLVGAGDLAAVAVGIGVRMAVMDRRVRAAATPGSR